jgi:hypothetical protein
LFAFASTGFGRTFKMHTKAFMVIGLCLSFGCVRTENRENCW